MTPHSEPLKTEVGVRELHDRLRTDWVRAQTHRRDHTRYLPPAIRDTVLRFLGRRIFHANHRPLLEHP